MCTLKNQFLNPQLLSVPFPKNDLPENLTMVLISYLSFQNCPSPTLHKKESFFAALL